MMGSTALVLGLILVVASVRFASVASVQITLVRFGFMWPGINNRVRGDNRIEKQ